MKQLNSLEEIKKFSITLKKSLENNQIDIKQSLILESIAKSLGIKDWNTLNAILKKQEEIFSSTHQEKIYIEMKTESGFYIFDYDENNNKLKISGKVGGACESYHIFTIYKEDLTKIGQCLLHNQNLLSNNKLEKKIIEYKSSDNIHLVCDINNCVSLKLSNFSSSFTFKNISLKNQKQLIDFFRKITKNEDLINHMDFIYPLTDSLLKSMAMRSDHSFGLWENKKDIEKLLSNMINLYELYKKGLSNEEIANQTNYSLTKIKQLREELSGTGFYNPTQ